MSRRRRRRTSRPFSPPSSPTSRNEASSATSERITIRQARTEQDALAIHQFMLMNAVSEMAEAPIDGPAYLRSILRTMSEGAALMAIVGDRLVGYLGIVAMPYSYSRASFLIDTGFWVMPEHRNGDVFKALLQEARGIADVAGMKFKLIINNPSRRRGTRTDMERTSALLQYQPAGAVLTFHPRGH